MDEVELFMTALKVADLAWEAYKEELDEGLVPPSDDPEIIFKRGVLSAIAGLADVIEQEKKVGLN
mgnify:CR=1 FL=1